MDRQFHHTHILGDKLSDRSKHLILFGILYQLLYVWQGLDFTDTGFHLTSYQRIFSDPETVHYSFMFWLSNIVGGLWMKLFPGLFANRLLSVLVHSGLYFIYYKMLATICGKNKAVSYLFISLFFFQYFGFETMNYDSLSILGMSLGVYFLYFALLERAVWKYFIGAMILGISTYFRVTNLASIGFLPLTILGYWYLYKKVNWGTLLYLGLGYLVGHLSVLLLMHGMGHLPLFFSNLQFVKEMGAAGDSSHGIVPVTLLYVKGLVKIGMASGVTALLFWTLKKYRPLSNSRLQIIVLSLFSALYFYFLITQPTPTWSKMRYLLYGGSLLTLVWAWRLPAATHSQKEKKTTLVLTVAAVSLFLIFPLGSDSGVDKLYFSSGLVLGVLFYFISYFVRREGSLYENLKYFFLGLYFITCLVFGLSNTYFDGDSRLYKIYSADHPSLSLTFTSKERSSSVTDLVNELSKHVSPNDYVLAFSDIPMVNYLSKTKPYIGTSWPKLYYDPAIFKEKLLEAYALHGPAVVVLQKMEMRSSWPQNETPDYLDLSLSSDGKHPQNRLPEHYKTMFTFLENNNYSIVWESDVFRIYNK